VLVTGASGFVGRRLARVLQAAGWRVRCLSRDAASAARRWPGQTWVEADLSRADGLARALDGCQLAFYLVHSLGEGTAELVGRERARATAFALAAERAGLERIVYLGGVAPQGSPSEHLRSRLEAGAARRAIDEERRSGHMALSGRVLEVVAGSLAGGRARWIR
jgi:uncharacterized protein YbjT (DUF2867 family)